MPIGVWLVDARGAVAITAVVGATAVRAGAAPPTQYARWAAFAQAPSAVRP
ncbi:hypothetical protein [Microbispora rosea]|uniref:hypothetical protein n=1 Tax=Microbispora rosea TaxID=58117 RepID=UPI003793258C